MANAHVRLNEMVSSIKDQGHRLTPQRMAVLKILATSRDHPSAEQIYERVKTDFPMTSLATVYKTVTLLKELGQVLELGFSDDSNRYDGYMVRPHPHLICVECKSILDPDVDMLDTLAHELATLTGYKSISYRMDFFGICPRCQRTKLV